MLYSIKESRGSALSDARGPQDNARTALGEDFFSRPWGIRLHQNMGLGMAQDSKNWSPKAGGKSGRRLLVLRRRLWLGCSP
ncbi:MAG: hypothetical protein CM1200mP18_13790 [Gammaproteobacteria bacterium]|nr:MAG: hypothetical protein CM1200mP18_13790 [Gammaproteobacteria bacterium]